MRQHHTPGGSLFSSPEGGALGAELLGEREGPEGRADPRHPLSALPIVSYFRWCGVALVLLRFLHYLWKRREGEVLLRFSATELISKRWLFFGIDIA